MPITVLKSIPEMEAAVEAVSKLETEAERIQALCDVALEPVESGLRSLDPFSPEYRQAVLDIYLRVSGKSTYRAELNELSPYLTAIEDERPGHYLAGNTAYAGGVLVAMGAILQTMNLKPGQKLLEYGTGEGGIAIEAAKCGVDVTVVDIEQRYLSIIERRAAAAKVSITTRLGEFGCVTDGAFDVVLFFEAFHHSLDHFEVARGIRKILAPGGRLILAGEPVIGPHNEHWRSSVPYPWGLRMDGVSFRAIKAFGWMELGFDHDYMMEMLRRTGYDCELRLSPADAKANCYIATPRSWGSW